MTNEELAMAIRESPKQELYLQLWEQVGGFVRQSANRFYSRREESCVCTGITRDDLAQYGYFALADAVKAYDPEQGYTFLTYLKFPLQNRFNQAVGTRGTQKRDPLNNCTSLDIPLLEEENGDTIGDMIPDPQAEERIAATVEREYNRQLTSVVLQTLDTISERQREIILRHYYGSEPLAGIAREWGVSNERVRQLEQEALKKLKKARSVQNFNPSL